MAERPRAPRRSLGDALGGWFERHLQTLVASLGRLVRQPFGTALTLGVIGVALALPAALHVFVDNARQLADRWEGALDLTVYMRPGLPDQEARQLAARLEARADVAATRVVPAAEGLEEFRRWSGLGAALDALRDNPLPAAVVVTPRLAGTGGGEVVEALAAALRAERGVDQVQLDTAWVQRFEAMVAALRRAASLVAAVLAVAVLMIVGNTIRLDIDGRRAEIEVTKLVGGSNGFVRRPFLYGGAWYGLGGGFVAWLLVTAFVLALGEPVAGIAAAYGSRFELQGLGLREAAVLIGGGTLLGWLGAWISATRHLRAIEPGFDT